MKTDTWPWWLVLTCALAACGQTEPNNSHEKQQAEREQALAERAKTACASNATYDRLKQVAFDEAIRIRNADPVNLDLLSTHALVRVENPIVKSRDKSLDVTVCSGRMILHVPPGAEKAFAGKRQLVADIEYAAQAAADGSGLVYRIKGAEPIIASLAAFDLKGQAYRPPQQARQSPGVASADRSDSAPETRPAPSTPAAVPSQRAATRSPPSGSEATAPRSPAPEQASAPPSFNCRLGRSRSEQMVCNSVRLASLDRTMSSQFYAELSRGDEQTRAELRRTRDRFLSRRERCDDDDCVAQVYRERMNEIETISGR